MDDNQLPTKEVIFPIELPLDHECCNFALDFGVGARLTITKDSIATNNTQVWVLVGKQRDYWKPKGCFSLAWAFFVATTSSSLEVSSNENEIRA
jgi:hypothetical protein